MPPLQIAYLRNAAYFNESASHLVPARQMISPSEFMKMYQNEQFSPLASFQICDPLHEDDGESFLADELAIYLVEVGWKPED